jgi:hypothetical protein
MHLRTLVSVVDASFLSICQLAGALPVSCQKRVNSNDDFDSLGGKAIRDVVTNGWE